MFQQAFPNRSLLGGEGPDRIINLSSRVLFVDIKGLIVNLFKGPYTNLYSH
jgi:hypothetical protein